MPSSSTFGRRAAAPPSTTAAWAPVAPVASPSFSATADSPFDKTPYLSIGLLTLLALIFIFQPTAGLPMGPGMEMSLHHLMAVGGVSRHLVVEEGEWWRIFTAPLLHANLAHIVGNAVVMGLRSDHAGAGGGPLLAGGDIRRVGPRRLARIDAPEQG
jgi:membrane associated rhomboid family serine protease